MKRVAVLAGGTSEERDVSLRSGQAVAAALRSGDYDVRIIDPSPSLDTTALQGIDVVFPVLHGEGGEDGTIQKLLDASGLPYVGTAAIASALCFDKWQYKQLLTEHDIRQAPGELVDEAGFWRSELSHQSFILKPNDGGSSIDNLISRNAAEKPDPDKISKLLSRHPKMLLEALIDGTEITVAVLGEESLPVIEIIPPQDAEFNYENKYNGLTQELCPPRHVSPAAQAAARELALRIHQLAGCRDFSRTDMIVNGDTNLYVLETNTIPGMTDQSLFPKAAQAAGISMAQLVDSLVQMALRR